MPCGNSAYICLFPNGAESLTRADNAEWAGAPAAGLSARGVEGSIGQRPIVPGAGIDD